MVWSLFLYHCLLHVSLHIIFLSNSSWDFSLSLSSSFISFLSLSISLSLFVSLPLSISLSRSGPSPVSISILFSLVFLRARPLYLLVFIDLS